MEKINMDYKRRTWKIWAELFKLHKLLALDIFNPPTSLWGTGAGGCWLSTLEVQLHWCSENMQCLLHAYDSKTAHSLRLNPGGVGLGVHGHEDVLTAVVFLSLIVWWHRWTTEWRHYKSQVCNNSHDEFSDVVMFFLHWSRRGCFLDRNPAREFLRIRRIPALGSKTDWVAFVFIQFVSTMGWVVRKPVNSVPRSINQSIKFSCMKMLFTDLPYVLCSLGLWDYSNSKQKTSRTSYKTEIKILAKFLFGLIWLWTTWPCIVTFVVFVIWRGP